MKVSLSASVDCLNTNIHSINTFIFNLTFCTQYSFINSRTFYMVFDVIVTSLACNSFHLIKEKCTAT